MAAWVVQKKQLAQMMLVSKRIKDHCSERNLDRTKRDTQTGVQHGRSQARN